MSLIQQLTELNYSKLAKIKLDTYPPVNVKSSVEFYDDVTTKIIENQLLVDFQRYVQFEPQQLFSIVVTYSICWNIVDGKELELSKQIANLSDEDKEHLLGTTPFEVSLIISQLIKALDYLPLITPPTYISPTSN